MIQYDYPVLILAALMLLILPMDWILAAIIAASFHELCHIAVLYLLHGRIKSIRFQPDGCIIKASGLPETGQILSIFAGPLGSFSLMLFCRCCPQIAVCGLFQGLYNLLPILPLDGGRLMQLLLYRFCPACAEKVLKTLKIVICICYILFSIWLTTVYPAGIWLCLFALVWCGKGMVRKIPCKPPKTGVQ